jgi:tripartite-type tricarboxylate transporter receptor subunit TctC
MAGTRIFALFAGRNLLKQLLLALALSVSSLVQAQAPWPARPVRVVIPVVPGGLQDTLARGVGAELTRMWGQSVVIESRSGAGGIVAADAVAKSAPDGYTLLMSDEVPLIITPLLHKGLPYDPAKDFIPIVTLAQSSSLIVAPAGAPFNSMPELVAAAKARPGQINFASFGPGSTSHLNTEDYALQSGIRLTHVPYKGGADIARALMAAEIDVAFIGVAPAMPLIKQGRVKAIGYAGEKRLAVLPEVPLVSDSLPGFETRAWFGWFAPTGSPRTALDRIAADVIRVIDAPGFKEKFLDGAGLAPYALGPDAFGRLVTTTRAKYQALTRRLKLDPS